MNSFPLQLAFAMTINKAQGQTLRHVGLCLTEPVFTHGQLYVAYLESWTVQTCESLFQILLGHVVKGKSRILCIQKYLVNINVSFHVIKVSSIEIWFWLRGVARASPSNAIYKYTLLRPNSHVLALILSTGGSCSVELFWIPKRFIKKFPEWC